LAFVWPDGVVKSGVRWRIRPVEKEDFHIEDEPAGSGTTFLALTADS